MTRKFETTFSVAVSRVPDHAGVVVGAATLADALSEGFRWACFYMGTEGARVTIFERCKACEGIGRVRKNGRAMRCATCRGLADVAQWGYLAKPQVDCEIYRYGERVSAPRREPVEVAAAVASSEG